MARGTPCTFREQEAIIYTHNRDGRVMPHGVPMVLSLKGREPYAVGEYALSEESIYVNRWGQLEIAPVLRQVSELQDNRAA